MTCNWLSSDAAKGFSPQQSGVGKWGYLWKVVRGLPRLPSIPEVPVSPSGRREVLPKCKILLVMQAEQESEVCFDFPQRHRRESPIQGVSNRENRANPAQKHYRSYPEIPTSQGTVVFSAEFRSSSRWTRVSAVGGRANSAAGVARPLKQPEPVV